MTSSYPPHVKIIFPVYLPSRVTLAVLVQWVNTVLSLKEKTNFIQIMKCKQLHHETFKFFLIFFFCKASQPFLLFSFAVLVNIKIWMYSKSNSTVKLQNSSFNFVFELFTVTDVFVQAFLEHYVFWWNEKCLQYFCN